MTLEQRVAKLERQNRWLRRGGAVLFALVAVVLLLAQAADGDPAAREMIVADKIEAREILFKGPAGKATLQLFTYADGEPAINLRSATVGSSLLVRANGVSIRNRHGVVAVNLCLTQSHAGLSLRAPNDDLPEQDRRIVDLSASDDEDGALVFHPFENKNRAYLLVKPSGHGEYVLGTGKARVRLVCEAQGTCQASIADSNGKVIWEAPGE